MTTRNAALSDCCTRSSRHAASPAASRSRRTRGAQRLLHEEQPACCISCGKPFATKSMLKVMAKKLEDHWMFQSDADRRRLEMCEDCRVKDLMRAQQGGGPG
jgi:hypothetical protein